MDPFKAFQAVLAETVEASVERALSRHVSELPSRAPTPLLKEWLTTREVQDYLGVSKSTVARFRSDGVLPYSRVGQNVYVRRADVEALLERSAVRPRSGAQGR